MGPLATAVPGVTRALPEIAAALPGVTHALSEIATALSGVARALPEIAHALPAGPEIAARSAAPAATCTARSARVE